MRSDRVVSSPCWASRCVAPLLLVSLLACSADRRASLDPIPPEKTAASGVPASDGPADALYLPTVDALVEGATIRPASDRSGWVDVDVLVRAEVLERESHWVRFSFGPRPADAGFAVSVHLEGDDGGLGREEWSMRWFGNKRAGGFVERTGGEKLEGAWRETAEGERTETYVHTMGVRTRRVSIEVGRGAPGDDALREFANFMPQPSALTNNVHGTLAGRLMGESAFAEWLESTVARAYPRDARPGPLPLAPDPVEQACIVADACTAVKCYVGGVANPLCVACGGVSAACLIYNIGCWIFNC